MLTTALVDGGELGVARFLVGKEFDRSLLTLAETDERLKGVDTVEDDLSGLLGAFFKIGMERLCDGDQLVPVDEKALRFTVLQRPCTLQRHDEYVSYHAQVHVEVSFRLHQLLQYTFVVDYCHYIAVLSIARLVLQLFLLLLIYFE